MVDICRIISVKLVFGLVFAVSGALGPVSAKAALGDMGTSLSGTFLAGQIASRMRDNENAVKYYTQALRRDPENRIILVRTLLLAIATGDIKRAARIAVKINRFNSDHHEARLVLALREMRAGRYHQARRFFGKSSKIPLSRLTSIGLSAWAHVGEGRIEKALTALDELKSSKNLKVFYSFHRALIADFGTDRKLADKTFRQAYQGNPRSLRVTQAFGRFLERQNKTVEALDIYKTFLTTNPNHPLISAAAKRVKDGKKPGRLVTNAKNGAAELMFGISSVLSNRTTVDDPLRYTRFALFMRPNFVLAQVLAGDIYSETRRYQQAVTAYALVPATSPLKRNSQIQLASSLDRMKKTDEAGQLLAKLIKRYPGDVEPIIVWADLLRSHSKFEQAAEQYSKAINLITKPLSRHWLLYYHRGISYERAKQWPKAERDLKKALSLSPDQPPVLNYLGYSWVEQGHNLKEAMKMIRKAVKMRSGDGYIVDSLGWAHFQLGQYEEATKVLERAVYLRPSDPVINEHLGDAYWHVGRKLEARFQWNHARDLKPEPDVLARVLEKIKSGFVARDKAATKPKSN